MLRGYRWQLAALLLSAVLFGASLALRSSEPPVTTPEATSSAPTVTADNIVIPPTAIPEQVSEAPVVTPASQNGRYREALVGRVQRLNPLFAQLNPVDRDITALIFEGLTRTDSYGEPIPALAQRWIISSDGLEYIVFLREDVLWQDGVPFTAADVVYTMSLLRSPDFPGNPQLGAFWRTIETEQLGDYLVRFRLAQPLGNFLDRLQIGILPEHALSGTTAAQLATHPFNLTPIGTGPYQLEALRSSDGVNVNQVDLRVSPIYRQRTEGQQHAFALDSVSFMLYDSADSAIQALQNHSVDGFAVRDRSERTPTFNSEIAFDFDMHNALEATLGVIIYNQAKHDFLREQRVRIALETGIDRTSTIQRTMSNTASEANSPLMPLSWAYVPNLQWPAYNPDEARQLLITAEERLARINEANGSEETAETEATDEATPSSALFTFTILTPDDLALVSLANEIATQWSQLNLSVSVEAVDSTTYQSRLQSHDFDAALVEYSLGDSADPDVYSFWHEGQYPDGMNYGGVADRRISELLEKARQDPFGINRVSVYQDFQREFVERAVALPLYYPLFTFATSPSVRGVQLGFIASPADRFRTIGDWSMAQ
jgi:peptide/nickel transport system substrate-binding protein